MLRYLVALVGLLAAGSTSAMSLKSTATMSVLPWGAFSVTPALYGGRVQTKVEVAKVRLSKDPGGSKDFWVAEKIERERSGQTKTLWADSRSCSTLVPSMSKLANLEPIQMTPPGFEAGRLTRSIIMDGATYEIRAQGVYPAEGASSEVQLTGNVDTPIAKWVDGTLSAVAPCWTATAPMEAFSG